MNLHTFYTSSHKPLFDEYFSTTCSGVNVIEHHGEQYGDGTYTNSEFVLMATQKLAALKRALRDEQQPFMFTDVDIVFLRDDWCERAIGYLESTGADMACANDVDHPCTGFMVLRPNAITRQLWHTVWNVQSNGSGVCDQGALYWVLINQKQAFEGLKLLLLPIDEFQSAGCMDAERQWKKYQEGDPILINPDAYLFHANFCEGMPAKQRLLNEALRVRQCSN